ncbi:hypothetical protein BDZ89DRAFT_1137158 [Hymenopellis radicata]|nr:hypothetical protein BDZ89DRAFT_1137158 [Hymenopellis radicata]
MQEPSFNYVIVHTAHMVAFDGVEGVDWGHRHQELDIQIGGTIGFEIYTFRSGTFTLMGDGGFTNFAFIGIVTSDTMGRPRTIQFASPA